MIASIHESRGNLRTRRTTTTFQNNHCERGAYTNKTDTKKKRPVPVRLLCGEHDSMNRQRQCVQRQLHATQVRQREKEIERKLRNPVPSKYQRCAEWIHKAKRPLTILGAEGGDGREGISCGEKSRVAAWGDGTARLKQPQCRWIQKK
ncbi:hypothetical protein BLNAU_21746 [Blattamonas nauphoetae]|uniref:Uncharacterized protein n=1 Tax=Blattamonas nauphoetae TaxID=2049346 RepID=A0ABQ9WV14_9EUKA|nr:hypothetical protein BLNAU_21746 [Blattamonas nauphoetae]